MDDSARFQALMQELNSWAREWPEALMEVLTEWPGDWPEESYQGRVLRDIRKAIGTSGGTSDADEPKGDR